LRRATIRLHDEAAALFIEHERNRSYEITYLPEYNGSSVSLTMPVRRESYRFDRFPPFVDGLLPEGTMLDALLRSAKIDRDDPFSQILVVGKDLVGAVTVEPFDGDEV